MGFFDSIKNSVENAKAAKAARDAEKAEQERLRAEQAQANKEAKTAEILGGKLPDKPGVFEVNSIDDTLNFTRDFMVKLLLPATRLKATRLVMTPYAEEKSNLRPVTKTFDDFDKSEQLIFTLKSPKEYIAVTTAHFYGEMPCAENADNYFTVKIPLADISEISFADDGDEAHKILINNSVVMSLPKGTRDNDFINLSTYFERLANSDFEITETQIDALIHKKIGDTIYADAQKYMDSDELIQYFVWGVDSLTAADYLMCTTHQFVNLDRELLGATKDVTRFFYEDITSMKVLQNNDGSLTGAILNAALSLCDLEINVAGAKTVIHTLTVKEAERVVQIYNFFRRKAREDAKKPIMVQAVNAAPAAADPLEQLTKLGKLKEAGIITEEEFAAKKADLLSKM